MKERLEITDVVVDYDPETLARRPVTKEAALARLRGARASRFALRLVEALPERDGALDPDAVDGVIVRAHGEMQRLWEAFLHGRRVAAVIGPLLALLREREGGRTLRVVDVGCGSGYVLRWLAAHRALGDGVELCGADYNPTLVGLATRLAEAEGLDCRFVVANAFRMERPADVYLSTGVIHHFRAEALDEFFGEQAARGPAGFFHFDVQPSWAAPLGSWLFHKAKFREPIGQHDGVMSTIRAHRPATLLDAARRGAPGYRIGQFNRAIPWLPIVRTMHAVLGLSRTIAGEYLRTVGSIGPIDLDP
jgi:SAM-dependent methyltransferase